jgi:phosphatidylserine/phosphatidylglycerophosphate/cardiolipin synthase-like enzyme
MAVLVVALLIAPFAAASASNDDAEQAYANLGNRTNLHPRAFVEDHKILVTYTNGSRLWMLKATWVLPRVTPKEFIYASATLQPSKKPKAIPGANSDWHEVTVLPPAETDGFLRKAADRLVPSEPGHGIFCRFALGEATLYRDAAGKVQLASQTNPPVNVTIDRRYTRQGLASAVATELETTLKTAHPGRDTFLMAIGHGSRMRLVFLDLNQRQTVVLYLPGKDDEPGKVAGFGKKLQNLGSFIVVDNLFTFLKNPVTSSTRAVNQAVQWPQTLLPRQTHPKSEIPPLTNAPGMDLVAWEHWLDHHAHAPRELGSLRLLIDGDQFFPLFERRVAEAQHSVDILVCIFDRDDFSVEMANRLRQRSTNIEVRVVFDRMMTRQAGELPPGTQMPEGFTEPKSIASYLRHDSEVHVRPQPNPAFTVDHTKLYLVDGRYAYVGGMNVGREYRYEWHDCIAEIEGPIVASYQRQFNKKWAQFGPWGDLGLAAESIGGKRPRSDHESTNNLIELRRLYTKNFSRQIRSAEVAAIDRASSYVFAENPYLYGNEIINALVHARRRGVDVRVILPSENDLTAGRRSNVVIANYLREQGIRVYIYPGMTHIKALLVDGWACLGSANFDALSLRLNREDDLATSNPAFVAKFRHDLFDADFQKAGELKEELPEEWKDHLADFLLNPL